jgi:peptide/nickel transport system substrate-binding protein
MKEREDEGKIKILIPRMHRLPINFDLNLTMDDPTWRKVTGDVRFRQALSYAINRQEILDTFYFSEYAKLPEQTNPSEFSVDKANELLDAIGLDKKDGEGFRLGPDGKRFSIIFEIGDLSEDHVPMSELIAEYWNKVGVNTTVKKEDWGLVNQRWGTNELMGTSLWAHTEIWPSAGWDDYLPSNFWGQKWGTWYTSNGKGGEEPPPEVKKLYDLHSAFVAATVGSAESKAAMDGIMKSYRDNVWTFNVVEHSYYPTFFSKNLQNVPSGRYEGLGIVVMYSMEQWYFDSAA